MTAVVVGALLVVGAVVVQIVLPGKALYHVGWFNVALAALTALVIVRVKSAAPAGATAWCRWSLVALAVGTAICGLAGVASGLLAPDNRTVVASPGARVALDDFGGTLRFPLQRAQDAQAPRVALERQGRSTVELGSSARNLGSAVAWTVERTVVTVEARDPRGGRLTVTQPTGSTFLSPVLLMSGRQTIAGMDLPFDAFAVPAAHRTVKAVLFSASQASQLRGMAGRAVPAVLFAVDDEDGRAIPGAIALAQDGQSVRVGGLRLRAVVSSYPAVEIVAAPPLAAIAGGGLCVVGGLIALGMHGKENATA